MQKAEIHDAVEVCPCGTVQQAAVLSSRGKSDLGLLVAGLAG